MKTLLAALTLACSMLLVADEANHLFILSGQVISLLHIEADPSLRGQGTAARLMEGGICTKGLKARPVFG